MAHFPGPGFATPMRIGADPDQYHGGKKCGSSVSQTLQFVIKYMLLFYRYSKKGGIGNSSDTVQVYNWCKSGHIFTTQNLF